SPAWRFLRYGTPLKVRLVSTFCAARVMPLGKRRSVVTTRNGSRSAASVLSQASYPPELSAMPSQNCDIWCQLAGPVANACAGQTISQPVAGLAATLKSAVMPVLASAMMLTQSAEARSAGVRPTLARNRALYERIHWKYAVVSSRVAATAGSCPGTQVAGSGNEPEFARAMVTAESSSV